VSTAHPIHAVPLTTLYSEHHGWLFAWLRGKLGNRTEAADLAQDTFLRLLGKREGTPLAPCSATTSCLKTAHAKQWANKPWSHHRALSQSGFTLPQNNIESSDAANLRLSNSRWTACLLAAAYRSLECPHELHLPSS